MKRIAGTQQVINNLMMKKSKVLREVGVALEKTCVDVSKHAKAGHVGNQAHMNDRYRNQTTTLTRSITPKLVKIDFKKAEGVVFSNVKYAPGVELGTSRHKPYPFLFPALVANKENFKKRLKGVIG